MKPRPRPKLIKFSGGVLYPKTKSIRKALMRSKVPWFIDGSGLDLHEKELNSHTVDTLNSVIKRKGKARYLNLGCGTNPKVFSDIQRELGTKANSVEMQGSHVTRKEDWEEYLKKQERGYPHVKFHRATIGDLGRKGVKGDVIEDYYGPIFHSNNPARDISKVHDKLLKPGGTFSFMILGNPPKNKLKRTLDALDAKEIENLSDPDRNEDQRIRTYRIQKALG